MTNNELSRKVLFKLQDKGGNARFRDLLEMLGMDARTIFKNLFFLEEKGYIQLSTSYPTDAVYPQIHLVRLRKPGEALMASPAQIDAVFPLSDTTTDLKPHIPPDLDRPGITTPAQALESLAVKVRQNLKDDERDSALEKIESLLQLAFVHEPIGKTGA